MDENEPAIGRTKIGGCPDLPDGLEWPVFNDKHLAFIAQINLAEVSEYDIEKSLPGAGILYFFYDADQETWGYDPEDLGGWKVIYYDGDRSLLKRIRFPEDIPEGSRYQACKVDLMNEPSLPAWESMYIEELNLSEAESDAYLDLFESENEGLIIHKILGHPNQVQGDMQLECQLVSNGLYCGDSSGYHDPRRKELEKSVGDWRLLLQIDSDEETGIMWGDTGRIYYWIREEDLRNKRFDKVWMVLQCY
jgi:uncharacterized protein YwqG